MARGDIWLVEFPSPEGNQVHEQIGDRPGIVVQTEAGDQSLPTTIVIPMTSIQKAQRFPYTFLVHPSAQNGLDRPSVLLVFQIRAIDKSRLQRRLGRLEDEYLRKLENQIRDLLAI